MNRKIILSGLVLGSCVLAGCSPQTTPSMMNTNKIQLTNETVLQQIPVADVKDGYLYKLADDYARYGAGGLQLSIGYDPKSKSYTAMKAFNDLADFKTRLTKMGVRNITAETVKSEGATPMLMVSFDSMKAQAPAGCTTAPGVDDNLTTRFIGDYKFGCSVETMTARQVYRPSDLQGQDQMDAGDGRRAANSLEHYRNVSEDEASGDLTILGRDQIQGQ